VSITDPNDQFSGSAAKLARARKLLSELEIEIGAFFATNPVKIVDFSVFNNGRSVSLTVNNEGVPDHISTVFGDIIHNLRSSLDIAACELVRAVKKSDKKVYFPFSSSEAELDKQIGDKNFRRAGTMATALLKSLQPYSGGNIPLRAIHDLDLQDKHHRLIPASQSYYSPVWKAVGEPNNPQFEIVSTEITGLSLVFPPDCPLSGEKVIPTFEKLVELVDGIIGSFRKLASDPSFPGA
jgi:hypothetical protein